VLLAKEATSNARGGMCNNEPRVYREELGILFRRRCFLRGVGN